MDTRRQRPTFEIGGIPFIVDVDNSVLLHPGDARSIIFFSDMEDKGDHYLLQFDRATASGWEEGAEQPGLLSVKVPQMVTLDPEGVAQKYSTTIDKLPKRDADLKCDPILLERRMQGIQPTIDICGHTFFAHLRFGLLQPKDDFNTMGLEVHKMQCNDSGTHYQCWYNYKTHSEVKLNRDITAIPKNVVPLEIPIDVVLDPYAVLRDSGHAIIPERFDRFPIRYNLKASVLPWEETIVPALIKKNRAALQQKKKEQQKRKGKGL